MPARNIQLYLRVCSQCHHEDVQFADELSRVLPSDIPNRERLIEKSAQHLQLVSQANENMNLTRITNAREAAIKHIFDSVAPWAYFKDARRILDAGTGAGFPGIPLSLVLPEARFTLAESIQKKARFVDAAVESLHLSNVDVVSDRAEERALSHKPNIITARAVAPLHKLLELFSKALKQGSELILYKGPEIEAEMAETKFPRMRAEVLTRYQLPDQMGSRSIVRVWFQR
jgi:16S rRNA (guanine527-N7)-methyltransferase